MKFAAFIGRYQPFHLGHEWLINNALEAGKPVLILIRATVPDTYNPLESYEVLEIIKKRYKGNPHVVVQIIPDIESINYGRGVGYGVIEHEPPSDVSSISATEIRMCISSGDWSWRRNVHPSIWDITQEKLGRD